MEENLLIKTTQPFSDLSAEQKVKLNRRGNELFNAGEIEMSARIFRTTKYSDGLTRVGDYYYEANKKLMALEYYRLANNKKNIDILVKEIANTIRVVLD